MKELLTPDGRSPRSTYWNFFGFVFVVGMVVQIVLEIVEPSKMTLGLIVLCFVPLGIIGTIVQIRRWHDLNKSGWWVLINLIPVIGGIWSLIECGFVRGTEGNNQFGPDPRAATSSSRHIR